MGAAKRRGTFEKRQAEAIAAGRIKKEPIEYPTYEPAAVLTKALKYGLGLIKQRKALKSKVVE